jgi:hypothetical protein
MRKDRRDLAAAILECIRGAEYSEAEAAMELVHLRLCQAVLLGELIGVSAGGSADTPECFKSKSIFLSSSISLS